MTPPSRRPASPRPASSDFPLLRPEEQHFWERVRTAVAEQTEADPAPAVYQRVLARVRQPQRRVPSSRLASTASSGFAVTMVAALILALMWMVVQPGVVLAWKPSGESASTYRVLRAPDGSRQFELVAEIPAGEAAAYTYVDLFLLPWQEYTYVVEGKGASGQTIASQAVTGRALEALPMQVVLVLASLAVGFAIVLLVQNMLTHLNKSQRNSNIFPRVLS